MQVEELRLINVEITATLLETQEQNILFKQIIQKQFQQVQQYKSTISELRSQFQEQMGLFYNFCNYIVQQQHQYYIDLSNKWSKRLETMQESCVREKDLLIEQSAAFAKDLNHLKRSIVELKDDFVKMKETNHKLDEYYEVLQTGKKKDSSNGSSPRQFSSPQLPSSSPPQQEILLEPLLSQTTITTKQQSQQQKQLDIESEPESILQKAFERESRNFGSSRSSPLRASSRLSISSNTHSEENIRNSISKIPKKLFNVVNAESLLKKMKSMNNG